MKKRNIIIIIIGVVFFLLGNYTLTSYVCYKLYHRDDKNKQSIMSIHEAMVINQTCKLDSTQYDVLCLGNSITLHSPYKKINWNSNHGMSASSPEKDYVHILEQKLKNLNKNSTVTPTNISGWEKTFTINLDSIILSQNKDYDIIIIRLGENVIDYNNFQSALSDLIDKCLQHTPKVYITGQFWANEQKEAAIIANARNFNIKYIPIDWIYELYKSECTPNEGDTLIDIDGEFYTIKGDFITTHPNDYGMELIANTIYNAL